MCLRVEAGTASSSPAAAGVTAPGTSVSPSRVVPASSASSSAAAPLKGVESVAPATGRVVSSATIAVVGRCASPASSAAVPASESTRGRGETASSSALGSAPVVLGCGLRLVIGLIALLGGVGEVGGLLLPVLLRDSNLDGVVGDAWRETGRIKVKILFSKYFFETKKRKFKARREKNTFNLGSVQSLDGVFRLLFLVEPDEGRAPGNPSVGVRDDFASQDLTERVECVPDHLLGDVPAQVGHVEVGVLDLLALGPGVADFDPLVLDGESVVLGQGLGRVLGALVVDEAIAEGVSRGNVAGDLGVGNGTDLAE